MKVKIISDGTINGTTIVDEKTGEPLSGVRSIMWSLDIDMMLAKVVVELIKIPVEVVGDLEIKEDEHEVLQKR
jgi:hypothetical protein